MGGDRTWMVDCILITNHFTKRLFTYRAVQYFAAQNEEGQGQGPSVWNSIDEDIKLSLLSLFKKKMKQHFIKDY